MSKRFIIDSIFIVLLFLIFSILLLIDSNNRKTDSLQYNNYNVNLASNVKPEVQDQPDDVKYVDIELPDSYISESGSKILTGEEFETAVIIYKSGYAGDNSEVLANYLYIPKDTDITVPSLLSDYEFILIANTGGTEYQSYSLRYGGLTPIKYREIETINTDNFEGKIFASNDGFWAELKPVKNNESYYATVYTHSVDLNKLKELVNIASKYEKVEYKPAYSETSFFNEMMWKKYIPNMTDPSGKYKYYLPKEYKEYKTGYIVGSYHYEDVKSGADICIGLIGVENADPCGFSTSGCTCCNTGCGLVDIAMFTASDGELYLEPILSKGTGTYTMGSRFIYDPMAYPNPWLYYTQSFSTGDGIKSELGDYKKVLDLLHLIDSLERTY